MKSLHRLLQVLVLLAPTTVFAEDPDETVLEAAILDRAMRCGGAQVGKFDRALLRDMLRFEDEFKVPAQLHGMVLVAACIESGYDPTRGGDHKFSTSGKAPVAIGILQQWPWWSRSPTGPKIDRKDPRQAARAWVAHVAKQVPSVRRKCSFEDTRIDRLWRTAWITAVRAPSKTPRCNQTSRHWQRFTQWRRSWEPLLQTRQDEWAWVCEGNSYMMLQKGFEPQKHKCRRVRASAP